MNQYAWTQANVLHGDKISRRSFLRAVGIGAGALTLSWQDRMALAASKLRSKGKAMIVLWMQGGPTQFETWDPKPHSQSKSIKTAVPGIEVSENLPNLAKCMNDLCVVRSMSNKEGNHQRATYQLHTGNVPTGAIKFPSLGSLMSHELAPADFELPGFVSINGPSSGSGFLPVSYAPFQITDPSQLPSNSKPQVPEARFNRRLKLLDKLERGYATQGGEQIVKDHQDLYGQASKLVQSPRLSAFDISQESEKVRSAYGASKFGQGCLMARRLVEEGVTFVEVQLSGWDTHESNAERVAKLTGECDPAMATLIQDLKDRHLLDSTLVVWMGEFGRTPKINPRAGRDHFPRAFSMAMAGGGVPGGTVIGATDETGATVKDRPVSVVDLFSTFCDRLGVDPSKENTGPLNRPIKIVDGGKSIFA